MPALCRREPAHLPNATALPWRLCLRAALSAGALASMSACAPLQLPWTGGQALGGAPVGASAAHAGSVQSLLPADAVLLGERHDAPGQPERVLGAVQALAADERLAALVLEMAPAGTTTIAIGKDADEAAVRQALTWNERAWPWQRYAPAVMAAVRAGAPVVGGNLPDDRMRDAMADVSLDVQLQPAARQAQQNAIREGHCGLLPEKQIAPMTRVQIARDRSMAHVVAESVVPGRTVVLWAGAGHVDRAIGVPQHLPTGMSVRTVRMQAEGDSLEANAAAGSADSASAETSHFDRVWITPAMAEQDYCADLKRKLGPKR